MWSESLRAGDPVVGVGASAEPPHHQATLDWLPGDIGLLYACAEARAWLARTGATAIAGGLRVLLDARPIATVLFWQGDPGDWFELMTVARLAQGRADDAAVVCDRHRIVLLRIADPESLGLERGQRTTWWIPASPSGSQAQSNNDALRTLLVCPPGAFGPGMRSGLGRRAIRACVALHEQAQVMTPGRLDEQERWS